MVERMSDMSKPKRPPGCDDEEWANYLDWKKSLVPLDLDPGVTHLVAIGKRPKRPQSKSRK